MIKTIVVFAALLVAYAPCAAQDAEGLLTTENSNVHKLASSYDRSGGNADARPIEPGQTLVIFDADGPAVITQIWATIASPEKYHLKKLVLRAYWDNEKTPSVEAPIGDFFGLGNGEYFNYQSQYLQVASEKALNSSFKMPFQKHGLITVTNEGAQRVDSFYFNIDYEAHKKALSKNILYFHAQYRQAAPNKGWTDNWKSNDDAVVNDKKNLTGEGNYTWLDARGNGKFVGVTMSVVQNQDEWWGEGDEMFFIDGSTMPSMNGTGSEDFFRGAWDFGGKPFSYSFYGAPAVGAEECGSKSSVYRFYPLDSTISFTSSLRATIEHGHANARSDSFYSVAYWYQTEPHAPFPPLPPVNERLPLLRKVGGPSCP